MTTVSLAQIKYDVLNLVNKRLAPPLSGLVMPLTTTSAGSTTTIVDTLLARGSRSADDFNGCQVENITNDDAAGVDDGGFADSTGALTVSPAFTSTGSGDTYALYPPRLTPEELEAQANIVLRNTDAPFFYWPSMLTDAAAYMTGTVGTDWPDVAPAGAVTQTYDTADGYTFTGDTSLKVVTDTVDEGVRSAAIDVTEGETLLLSCVVACPTGSMIAQLYDVTNGAEIEASGTYDDPAFNEIRFTATVPDDCEQVYVRFLSKTAASTWYVAPPVALQSRSGHLYHLPAWFDRETLIERVMELPQGAGGEATFSALAHGEPFVSGPQVDYVRTARSINIMSIQFKASARPVVLLVHRGFDELSANTDTTTCDREYLKWKVAAGVCRNAEDSIWRQYARFGAAIARKQGYGLRKQTIIEDEPVHLASGAL